jgi:hypothetical protein
MTWFFMIDIGPDTCRLLTSYMAGFGMVTTVTSFQGIGLQACWFFSHQTELCGILRALPQLIDIHEK